MMMRTDHIHSTFLFQESQETLMTLGPKAPGGWQWSPSLSEAKGKSPGVRQPQLKSEASKLS